DTVTAVLEMHARDVGAIVVLGGDGTHRIVAKHCDTIPLCALSTGTNNVFPELREATVAGLATGLVATGCVATSARAGHREKVVPVGVADYERMEPDRTYPLPRALGSLALDGERELELTRDDEVELRLGPGPVRIDVGWVMAEAARRKLLVA